MYWKGWAVKEETGAADGVDADGAAVASPPKAGVVVEEVPNPVVAAGVVVDGIVPPSRDPAPNPVDVVAVAGFGAPKENMTLPNLFRPPPCNQAIY